MHGSIGPVPSAASIIRLCDCIYVALQEINEAAIELTFATTPGQREATKTKYRSGPPVREAKF